MRPSIFIKTFISSIILLFVDHLLVAQSQGAPESMNYQAVIRDGSGNIVANQSVGIRIDILQGSASGTSIYQETFTTTTNAYGSIAIKIGSGTVVSGTFNTIDWGADLYFVETAVDISGGNTYSIISTTQFVSVPYALYAKSSDAWSTNSNLNFTNNKVSVGNTLSSNQTYPLSVVSVHDGIVSRGIDVLRTDNYGNNIGVPMSFSMLNSNQEPFEFGKILGRTETNTAGSEVGGLSFHVADGTGTWGQNYQQERMRIDNDRITINAENISNSDAELRLRGTNNNGDHSQWVDLKSTFDGHITSSKFIISTRNQGTMNDNFVVNSSGRVGIGTTSPIKPLSVEFDDGLSNGEHIIANFTRTSPTSYVGGLYLGYFADGSNETAGILRSTGGLPLYIGTNSYKKLLTLNGAKLGINNVSPAYTLDVDGDINLTGSLRINGVVQSFGNSSSNSNFPAGMIMPFAGSSVPAGWLLCDGSSVSKTTYSDLYSAIGDAWGSVSSTSFNIPDLRGRFLRGVDAGAGNDPDASSRFAINTGANVGDNVGSYQDDEIKSHSHGITTGGGASNTSIRRNGDSNNSSETQAYGGNETRPKNAYVNYIIKF